MNEIYNLLLKKKKNELSVLDNKITDELLKNKTDLNSFFEKFLFNSAKRLRPLFIFLVCDYLGTDIDEDILNLSLSVELLHSASLIHDDILDDGELRRNLKCIHLDKGYKMAVLAGDYLLSLAMNALSEINNPKVFNLMANASYLMTKSEINAFNQRYKTPSLDEYIKRSKDKTSALFVSSVKSIFEIKKIKEDKKLTKFAENFALSFQIKDDINNFTNKDKVKMSSDKNEGIYTLPLILNSYGIIDEAIEFLNNLVEETKTLLEFNKGHELFELLEQFK